MKTFFRKLFKKKSIEIQTQTNNNLLSCKCGNKKLIINCNKSCDKCTEWFIDYTPRCTNWNYSNCQIKH